MYCPVIKYTLREPSIVKKERGSCIVQLPRSFLAAHLTKDLFLIAMQALSPANLNFFSAHPFCRNAAFPCSIHNKNRLPADSTKNSTHDGTLKNTPPKGNSSNITYTNRFATLWNSIGATIVPYHSYTSASRQPITVA